MLLTTGRKEKLSATKGTEIEVSSDEYEHGPGTVWYHAILEDNLGKSKRKKLSVRHLKPLVKEDYSPPLIKSVSHRLIRPVPPPPQDLLSSPEAEFEEGDVIDAAYKGGWWCGDVVKVLENQRYLVYIRFEPDVIEVDRKDLRLHLVWKDNEWFRCEKRELVESDFRAGKNVEVKIEVEKLGEVWAPAIFIKENEDGTLMVKYKFSTGDEDEEEPAKINFPYSKIRPSPPLPLPSSSDGLRVYELMEKVDAFVKSGWYPGKVSRVLSGKKYVVDLGLNKKKKKSMEFSPSELRPSMEWKDGEWINQQQVMDTEESPHANEEIRTPSTRIRVHLRSGLKDYKALNSGKKPRATRSSSGATMQSPPPASSNGGDVDVKASETQETATLNGGLGSNKMVDDDTVKMNGNTQVTSTQEKAATKEVPSSPSVVLGIASLTAKPTIQKTQGKTSPRKKLQTMKNQKSSANETTVEKAPEEPKTRESVNKRKRGQPRKFVSSEPKQKTGVTRNGSKATAITELAADMTDDDKPLASWILGSSNGLRQHQPVPRTPDSVVVEKHIDVMETTPVTKEDSTATAIVLPFAKKSPLWKVLESMEAFKTGPPQRPHFSPLLSSQEEFREGDAIGTMVMYTGLLEKLQTLQVHESIASINRINQCFVEIEKHGFDISAPQSRIKKLIEIKESQNWAMEELKVVEREITEKESKKRKIEEDVVEITKKIEELRREEIAMKESKVAVEKEIVRMQSHAAVLDQKVQNVEMEFRATVAAPLK